MGLNLGDEQKKRIFSLLRQSAIFRGLDDNSISLILRCARPKQFEKDQMLFDDGDLGDFMLIVLRGRIGIMK